MDGPRGRDSDRIGHAQHRCARLSGCLGRSGRRADARHSAGHLVRRLLVRRASVVRCQADQLDGRQCQARGPCPAHHRHDHAAGELLTVPIRVAVMGCVVNGPGEAREADLGVASGNGKGQIFVKGEVIKTVPESEIVQTLIEEANRIAAEMDPSELGTAQVSVGE